MRIVPGTWAERVARARQVLDQFNSRDDEAARSMASLPAYAAELARACDVLSLNEAVIVACGIVAFGEALRSFCRGRSLRRPDAAIDRAERAIRQLARHRYGDVDHAVAARDLIAAADRKYLRRTTHAQAHELEAAVWGEVLGTGPRVEIP